MKNLLKPTIRKKLFLNVIVVAIMAIIIVLVGYLQLGRIREFSKENKDSISQLTLFQKQAIEIKYLELYLERYFVIETEVYKRQALGSLDSVEFNLISAEDIVREEIKDNLTLFLEEVGNFRENLTNIITLKEEGGVVSSKQMFEIYSLIDDMSQTSEAINVKLQLILQDNLIEEDMLIFDIILQFLVLGALLLVFSVSISSFLARAISSPIVDLTNAAVEIGGGKFGTEIEIKSKDELGQLAETFNKMTYSIKERTRLLANAKSKDEAILAGIGEGMIVTDKERKITVTNNAAREMLCLKNTELMGKKWPEGVLEVTNEGGNAIPKEKMPIWKTITTGEVVQITAPEAHYFICKDKARFPVVITSSPVVLNKKIIGAVTVFRDITRERQVEKMKSEFVMLASHQLRTPLTSIKWVTEKLMKVPKKVMTEKDMGYLTDLNNSSNRLARLIDDLLTISRVEEGRIIVSPEEIDVVKAINDYFAQAIPWAERKGIKLTFEEHPESVKILTDKFALENILRTLVSNALDYTMQDGSVTVSLEKKDNSFILKVKDTGIGISEEDQKTVFEKFTRGSNAMLVKTEGTGLGLYIVKKTVEFLGGKIWFETAEKKGTTFFVEIPLKQKESKE